MNSRMFLSRSAGCLAGICLALAVLSAPHALRADEPSCGDKCSPYSSDYYIYSTCMQNCFAGITLCSPGTTPDCTTYKNENDCFPDNNNKCFESNVNCACRWKIANNKFSCICLNVTGK